MTANILSERDTDGEPIPGRALCDRHIGQSAFSPGSTWLHDGTPGLACMVCGVAN